ncbi:MAG: FAD-binding oxidoreductase [Desulfovibrio sp.]|jgi:FAD/FMN-containing dehydrogenase/Fe-S oxidoreductase|nr:FAD-binding oxidoreductase [Desulfovibrio sp.]
MLSKGPHISIEASSLVPRILHISERDFSGWPEAVRHLAMQIASELFLVRYNPFISAETVKKSVQESFAGSRRGLAHHYSTSIDEGITMFWSAHEGDMRFRRELVSRLAAVLPSECIDSRGHSLVENATDATDLRLELPLLIVSPQNSAQVSEVVRLANEMHFALVPRGSGTGLTGGAIPARKRSVILSLTRLTSIGEVDEKNKNITVGAGAITYDVSLAAAEHGLLFSVDPASKIASSIGGNIAENAGGPLCFEYGTTIDNLLSYRMVTPTGERIEIIRRDHPRHKIMPDETAVFDVRDMSGGLRSTVKLAGNDIRAPGLGKDVTNKTLSGLPGVQKEGTDGVIIDATFILHKKLDHYRVMVLEFFGRSMENCMLVITDVVALRNDIRRRGDLVKISALEEFGAKYVQAINYSKKSTAYEGDPISVLILQLDSDDERALDDAVQHIVSICQSYDGVDVFVAKDAGEAEIFWEDRHRLSAIAKRTSGFKINEDVVIPMGAIPDFALYLEALNLEYMGRAYRNTLKKVGALPGQPEEDNRVTDELAYAGRIVKGEISSRDLSDQELHMHAQMFFRDFAEGYPHLDAKVRDIADGFVSTCICVASHMHAGDGNWHVNIPVNSNDPEMLANAEKVARLVMGKAQELGGEVSGEHGIGITKIAFLTQDKMNAFNEFKQLVDPRNIFNPAKLTQRELPVSPFTFSFNRLIQDIRQSGLADKERLISLLTNVQVCTRCGKCRQHCPMHYPEQAMLFHPRNKNLVLGALIEAIYYSQVNNGRPDPFLLSELRDLVEHCTGCGKCTAVCPVKIASPEVALSLRGILEEEGAGGHPLKSHILQVIAKNPSIRIPKAAKLASIGQAAQNRLVPLLPSSWRGRFLNPLFSHQGPRPGFKNLMETLHAERGSIFVPQKETRGAVLYFPGCGGGVFYRNIGLAGLIMLLNAGYTVVLPEEHLCCGYPLLAAGAHNAFAENQDRNVRQLRALAGKTGELGFPVSHVLTACGSCRDGMERHFIPEIFPKTGDKQVQLHDLAYFLFSFAAPQSLPLPSRQAGQLQKESAPCLAGGHASALHQGIPRRILYHSPCHAEIPGVHKARAAHIYAEALAGYSGAQVSISPGCCGESGMGAMTSPAIYNKIRSRKAAGLERELRSMPTDAPVLVGCPSCKMGVSRIFLQQGEKRRVLHSLEYMAEQFAGPRWSRKAKKLLRAAGAREGLRFVDMAALHAVPIADNEKLEDDENGQ